MKGLGMDRRWSVLMMGVLAFFLFGGGIFVWRKTRGCLFADRKVCLRGKRYEKYNWREDLTAKAYSFREQQVIKAPFDGVFSYSVSGLVNYEGREVGRSPVLRFHNSENGEVVKLYVSGAELVKGQAGVARKVEKGEVVAKAYPEGIGFLDGYSAVRVFLPKR